MVYRVNEPGKEFPLGIILLGMAQKNPLSQ